MPIDVSITVDLEFAIAGCLHYPDTRAPVADQSVECRVDGRAHGLSYMLDILREYGLKATFFVETNHVHYFGDRPMGRFVERIQRQGHDIQLHIHPVWDTFRNPDWRTVSPQRQPSDRFADHSAEHAVELLAEGMATLRTWTGADPVAFRTGGMTAERMLYPAMAEAGLPLASNIGYGIHRPADPALHRRGGRAAIDGVLEVPVASYALSIPGVVRMDKCLTVVGSSLAEQRAVLSAAAKAGTGPVVVLTHPFEFVTADSEYSRIRVHPLVKSRFRQLCKYLKKNSDRYNVVTFGEQAPAWLAAGETADLKVDLPPPALLNRYLAKKLDWWTASRRFRPAG
jgi:peptidoglycan/xylan/chitin deacetylase (PgdA/CDA1 family)